MFFLIPFFNLSFSLVLTFFFCLFCFMHFFFNFSDVPFPKKSRYFGAEGVWEPSVGTLSKSIRLYQTRLLSRFTNNTMIEFFLHSLNIRFTAFAEAVLGPLRPIWRKNKRDVAG